MKVSVPSTTLSATVKASIKLRKGLRRTKKLHLRSSCTQNAPCEGKEQKQTRRALEMKEVVDNNMGHQYISSHSVPALSRESFHSLVVAAPYEAFCTADAKCRYFE